MIVDETGPIRSVVTDDLNAAIDALTTLSHHFGRETLSAAIGEISERLVAQYLGAERTPRGTRGHDLIVRSSRELIEVKARFLAGIVDRKQFNFKQHTQRAQTVFCVGWVAEENGKFRLETAIRVSIPYLIEMWATPGQPRYCARTTLGKLREAARADS